MYICMLTYCHAHLLELGSVGNGGVDSHDIGPGSLQIFSELVGKDGHTRVSPVEGGDIGQETLQESKVMGK